MDLSEDLRAKLPAHLSSLAIELAASISSQGGKLLIVGGSVRDLLIGENPEELDLEVRGLSTGQITSLLPPGFRAEEVGKSFGVLKIKGLPVEISLPRTERKTGTGHKGFTVEIDPNLPFELASERRDFTVNALGLDPLEGKLLDPHNGQKDLEMPNPTPCRTRFCRRPSPRIEGHAVHRPLRPDSGKRNDQLCAGESPSKAFHPNASTRNGKNLSSRDGSPQRGLISSSHQTGLGISPNSKPWSVANRNPNGTPKATYGLTHCIAWMRSPKTERVKIGKIWSSALPFFAMTSGSLPLRAKTEDGRIRSPKHEAKGEEPTRAFLARMTNQADLAEQVVPLVRRHLAPRTFYNDRAGDGAIRRLARQVKRIDRLVRVAKADIEGRPPRQDDFPEGPWLLDRAEELKVKDSEPKPIVLGRHLVDRGLQPGPSFGPILEQCFEAQLDGAFDNESNGLAYLDNLLERNN